MPKRAFLGELEQLLLLAILRCGDDAYGLAIQRLMRDAGRKLELPTIYTTLERLEEKGMVSSELGGETPVRGGRKKRLFKVEGAGMRALREVENTRQRLRSGPEPKFA
jgi:DNA-binding PadR family transcriptional regulator